MPSGRAKWTYALIAVAATATLAVSAAVSTETPATIVDHPKGAATARAAVDGFLQALERHDINAMLQLMAPEAQHNEWNSGLLRNLPPLTSFRVRSVHADDAQANGSPPGSIASWDYVVALTPSAGFDNDDTRGSAYDIVVSEGNSKRWLVVSLGGG